MPNSLALLFANTNMNTNSKYWKQAWTLLWKKKCFLPCVTLSFIQENLLPYMRPGAHTAIFSQFLSGKYDFF